MAIASLTQQYSFDGVGLVACALHFINDAVVFHFDFSSSEHDVLEA